jgi:hypothetical protein
MVSAFPLLVAAFGTSGVGPLEIVGTHPKTLGFSRFLGFGLASRQLRRSSEGAGASRRLFDGADTTGEIRFTSVRPRRKQKRRILFTFGMSCPRDHRKRQSERSPARSGIYRTKRLLASRVCGDKPRRFQDVLTAGGNILRAKRTAAMRNGGGRVLSVTNL